MSAITITSQYGMKTNLCRIPHNDNCCNQALAQACAVCSPEPRSMSEIAMLRQLSS